MREIQEPSYRTSNHLLQFQLTVKNSHKFVLFKLQIRLQRKGFGWR